MKSPTFIQRWKRESTHKARTKSPFITTTLCALALLSVVTARTVEGDEPATRPAADPKVLVLPFVGVDPSMDPPAVGSGLQQSLRADLAKVRSVVAMISQTPVADETAALQAARSAGARYAVFGTYQSTGTDVRFTGLVVDAETGATVGALKSTGSGSELFDLQDSLGRQLCRHLMAATGTSVATSPVPEIVPKEPLRVTGRPALFKGIAPSVAADRNASAAAYRREFGRDNYFPYSYGYYAFRSPYSCGYFGQTYFPRGF